MELQTLEPRILLVEDDPLTREALAYILQVEGYSVATAEDGKEGFELLHSFPRPFVVLLDLGLPTVKWTRVLKKAKAGSRRR
jgi:two-component system phosphate regulon response regulator PhoB